MRYCTASQVDEQTVTVPYDCTVRPVCLTARSPPPDVHVNNEQVSCCTLRYVGGQNRYRTLLRYIPRVFLHISAYLLRMFVLHNLVVLLCIE